MRHSERGVTFIGWLFLLLPVAILLYAAIRLTPIYLNYMRVSKSLVQVAQEAKTTSSTNLQELRLSLSRRFDIESIEHPDPREVDIHREGDHWVVVVDYEELAPMFGNVSLLVQFHKQVEMQ